MLALKSAQRLSRAVRVEWVDGLRADFTYVWLRDNSQSQRRPSLVHLELNAQPEAIDAVANHLHVVWPPFLASDYSSEFLREHTKIKNRKDRKCTAATKVMSTPYRVEEKSVATARPPHLATVEWRDTAVDPGSVWPHLERIPSVVEVESATPLGRVHLVDAVAALQLMHRSHPEHFRFLTDIPIPYAQGFFRTSHKIANIKDGRILGCVFNNDIRSSEITTDCVEMYYQSMKVFNEICCGLLKTIILQPDETLIVDNAQVLLGAPAQKDRRLRLKLYD